MPTKRPLFVYVRGLLRQTLHAFERGEAIRTLILAVAALVIAYLVAVLGVSAHSPHIVEWTFGLWAVLLFLIVAPYQLWQEERIKVEVLEAERQPKLALEYRPERDLCAVRTDSSHQRQKAWYYRIRPRVLANGRVKGCQGHLVRVSKFEGGTWVRQPYSDPRVLRWVNKGFDPIDLDPGVPQMLDVFFLYGDGTLHLCDEWDAQISDQGVGGTYRLEIIATAENCQSESKTLEIVHSGKWEQPEVREIT